MLIGTPLSKKAVKLMLLGSGELGKEVTIEAQRLGVEVIAVDRYPHAPAMQIAHRSHVIDMLDRDQLAGIIRKEAPDLIVPEIEAIATDYLVEAEKTHTVIPTARAARLTMDREGIRPRRPKNWVSRPAGSGSSRSRKSYHPRRPMWAIQAS